MSHDPSPESPAPEHPEEASTADSRAQTGSSFDRYRQIYEGVALPVLLIDADSWRILAANEAALTQYGYSHDEFVGMSVLEVRPPKGRDEARRVLGQMPQGLWKASGVKHVRKDGSVFHADVWSRDTVVEGRAVRVATVSDVTERVALQNEVQQAQKMEAVGQLAGGIAHDFNNMLTAIIAGTDLLREHVEDDADAALEVREIRRVAQHAAALTRQLLAFSRQQVMRVEVVPLNDVVMRVEALLQRVLGPHVELTTQMDPDAWMARVDPQQLEQVIVNMAVNAQDAMPGGGVLEIATRNLTLASGASFEGVSIPAGEYAELAVRDTGVGMDPLTRARIFEPFFTTKPPPEGTGLGLSMAYGTVRQSGGFIVVESAEGEGTTFRILLPRAGAVTAGEVAAPSGAEARDGRAVLVVEDEDSVRRIIGRVLERMGFAVTAVANGEEALAVVEAGGVTPELLVTGLVMPRMSGGELAAQLSAALPDLRVLFISGYTDEAVGHLGKLGDGRTFLQKPFSVDSLSQAVREVLRGD